VAEPLALTVGVKKEEGQKVKVPHRDTRSQGFNPRVCCRLLNSGSMAHKSWFSKNLKPLLISCPETKLKKLENLPTTPGQDLFHGLSRME
jgi:hypothetical protein